MRTVRLFLIFCLLVTAFSPAFGAETTKESSPTGQLKPFINEVVSILTDPALLGQGKRRERRKKVMEVAHTRFDFTEMSKRVLGGKQWAKLTAEEKKYFVELFTKLLEYAYLGKIEDYSGQKVNFVTERIKADRAQVETTLVDKDVTLQIFYIMTRQGEQWMVYDVVVEGVSIVRNYMDQFKEILRQEGYAALVKHLEEKLATLEKSNA